MQQLKYIIRILVSLVLHPRETWIFLATAENDETHSEYMFRNFYYPLLGLMALVVLVCSGFNGASDDETFNLQVGMTCMVPVLVAYFVGPYISQFVIKAILTKFYKLKELDKERLLLFVFYCTGYLMALEMLFALVPSIQFLKFLRIYLIYITWSASSSYIRVGVRSQWRFGFFSFLILFGSPYLVEALLQKIQG